MAKKRIQELLVPPFPKKNISAALLHYTEVVNNFQASRWENCLFKVGKFVEAILKSLYIHVGKTPPPGRGFSADIIINGLASLPQGLYDDSIRILVPRACRFIYDIASNRGGRHDPGDIDPNEMDAGVSVSTCSWILAELIRLSQKGAMDIEEAKELVETLTAKKYPSIEEVDGRVYFYLREKTARDVALLALAHQHPRRLSKQDLIEAIKRNGFKPNNARMAVQRILSVVDNDGNDRLRILAPGLKEAEEILKAKASTQIS